MQRCAASRFWYFSHPFSGFKATSTLNYEASIKIIRTSTCKTCLSTFWYYFDGTDIVEGQPSLLPPFVFFGNSDILYDSIGMILFETHRSLLRFDSFIFKPTEAWRTICFQLNNIEFKTLSSLSSACPNTILLTFLQQISIVNGI